MAASWRRRIGAASAQKRGVLCKEKRRRMALSGNDAAWRLLAAACKRGMRRREMAHRGSVMRGGRRSANGAEKQYRENGVMA